MKIKNNIILSEEDFTARILKFNGIEKAYRFRYKIFCEELQWLPLNTSEKEFDEYDQFSIHFGVFSKDGKLVGYGRFILPGSDFMLEKEFKDLLNNHIIRKQRDTVEVSRISIDKILRSTGSFNIITMLLYKLMYRWSIKNKIRYWYMAIEPNYLKLLQKFFPCKQIGDIKFYQPNTATTAALLDLKEAEVFLLRVNQKLYEWFLK
ncbi:GNAT family N-acetyltransferase [Patescibacteria group bacterium]|nr:GNAT family N-acetyltransferase [Patescibacteria group bacterium]MBU4481456.1 GNAT family N-acetyltransferase [Patescibacteria group bacterium]